MPEDRSRQIDAARLSPSAVWVPGVFAGESGFVSAGGSPRTGTAQGFRFATLPGCCTEWGGHTLHLVMPGEERLQFWAKVRVRRQELAPVDFLAHLERIHVLEDEFVEPLLAIPTIGMMRVHVAPST